MPPALAEFTACSRDGVMVRCMDPTEIPLFQLADQRLAYLDRRQGLLAQNIARAGTPTQLAATAAAVAGERAPDGNAVSLDRQLVDVADTESAQQLTTQLYSKYMSFFRTALGR